MLMLSAICHLVRITLFIASTLPRSSTEPMFSYSEKGKTTTAKVGGIMERECACFQECVLREKNENVYEDSHTEHM